MKKYLSSILANCTQEMAALGYKPHAAKVSVYVREVNDECVGQLAISAVEDKRAKSLRLSAYVSVRFPEVEELRTHVSRRSPDPTYPTLGIGLASLDRSVKAEWVLRIGEPHAAAVVEIRQAFERFGVQFIEKNSSLRALYEQLKRDDADVIRYTIDPGQLKALVAFCCGDRQWAREVAQAMWEHTKGIQERIGENAQKTFARNFLDFTTAH